MSPRRSQFTDHASSRATHDLGARLEAMHLLLEQTVAQLHPADATGIALLRQRFDAMQREFAARRLEAEAARRRMRAHTDQRAQGPPEQTTDGHTKDQTAAAASENYAQDALLVAVIAFEEAELATLEAIVTKVAVDKSSVTE